MLRRVPKIVALLVWVVTAAEFGAWVRPGVASGLPESLPVVHRISIHPGPNGAVIVDVAATQRVPYRIFRLSRPSRLVVDLEGARKSLPKNTYPTQSEWLKRVRVGQWRINPAIVRVVADLKGNPTFRIHDESFGVRIEVKPRQALTLHKIRSRKSEVQTAESSRRDSTREGARDISPKAVFPVHRFEDLTASLAAPELSPQDHLVLLTQPKPLDLGRDDPANLAMVSEISIDPEADGETFVDIASTRSVPYRVFQLADPSRLVVDLKDARKASRRNVYLVDSSVLKRIRVGQWQSGVPSVVRVVADLQGFPFFDVHAQRPGVRIELKPRRVLGPLLRNPFAFAPPPPSAHFATPSRPPDPSTTTMSAPGTPGTAFPDLKVLGYVEKPESGMQIIFSDGFRIYFVPEGGNFKGRYRVVKITDRAVEVEDVQTAQMTWLEFTP